MARLRRACAEMQAAPAPVVLQLDKAPACCHTRGFKFCDWRRAYALSTPLIANATDGAAQPRHVRVDIHIRRGDVMAHSDITAPSDSMGRSDDSNGVHWTVALESRFAILHRAIPNAAYLNILRGVLSAIGRDVPVSVVLHCDSPQARPDSVPDVNASEHTNFSAGLPSRVRLRMGPADVLVAFRSMCSADVVVMSRSTLSWTAAALCARPAFLATPYHHSMRGFPNVHQLHARTGGKDYRLWYRMRSKAVGHASEGVPFWRTVSLNTEYTFDEQRLRNMLVSPRSPSH